MRNLFFLVLTISIGCFAQAQDHKTLSKPGLQRVDTISMPIEYVTETAPVQLMPLPIAGLFIMKHSRVKRALSFRVKATNPKLA
jgi:hypothetical protein